jgi:hypothetical protein
LPADRYRVQLYRNGVHRRRQEVLTNLDPHDDTILREWLERLVKADRGTLRLNLADGWELKVRIPDGIRVVATATVDKSGRTVVKR